VILNYLSVENLELFFNVCKLFDLNSPKEREALIDLMREKGFIQTAMHTNRTKEQIMKDLSKNFKVLNVEKKEDIPGEDGASAHA
jgi:hypothetical protein